MLSKTPTNPTTTNHRHYTLKKEKTKKGHRIPQQIKAKTTKPGEQKHIRASKFLARPILKRQIHADRAVQSIQMEEEEEGEVF